MQAPSHPASGPSLFFCGLSAVLLYGISGGIRSDIGILLEPLREATGLSYGGLSFAIAVLQLSFGLSQPFWGLLAARRSHRFVLLSGVGLFLLGLLGLSLFRSLWGLVLTLGLCLGCGAGAISFGLLLETVIFAVGPQKGALISGFINAAAGLGSTFFFPASFQAFPCRRNPDGLCCAQSDHDWNPSLSFLFDAAPKKNSSSGKRSCSRSFFWPPPSRSPKAAGISISIGSIYYLRLSYGAD